MLPIGKCCKEHFLYKLNIYFILFHLKVPSEEENEFLVSLLSWTSSGQVHLNYSSFVIIRHKTEQR